MMKKTEGRKYRDTVPLIRQLNLENSKHKAIKTNKFYSVFLYTKKFYSVQYLYISGHGWALAERKEGVSYFDTEDTRDSVDELNNITEDNEEEVEEEEEEEIHVT
jgi:hypothetical protein